MKRTLSLFLLILALYAKGESGINGILSSFPNTSFYITTQQSPLNNYNGATLYNGQTGNTGSFTSTFTIEEEQPLILFIDRVFLVLWLGPGASLTIKELPENRYTFSGTVAEENSFLFQTGIMQPFTVPGNTGINEFKPEKHLKYLDSIEIKRKALFTELSGGKNLSQKFKSYCLAEINGFTLFNKSQYPAILIGTQKIRQKDVPHTYYQFWNSFELAEDSIPCNTYQNALQGYLEFKTAERTGPGYTGTAYGWQEYFKTIDSLLVDYPFTMQKQKTTALMMLIEYFDLPDLTSNQLYRYQLEFPHSASLPFLENAWNKKNSSFTITPSFRLKNTLDEWIDIESLKGKVVYIDFWGVWCKACLLSMPYSETLQQKLKDKDVVFLFIDFYDIKEKWLDGIKKYKIGGVHLKAEKKDEKYFDKIFNINQGFPKYAIIDKKGQLITNSAPPPQEQSLYKLIIKYLNE